MIIIKQNNMTRLHFKGNYDETNKVITYGHLLESDHMRTPKDISIVNDAMEEDLVTLHDSDIECEVNNETILPFIKLN